VGVTGHGGGLGKVREHAALALVLEPELMPPQARSPQPPKVQSLAPRRPSPSVKPIAGHGHARRRGPRHGAVGFGAFLVVHLTISAPFQVSPTGMVRSVWPR
jgi:hypothetical protein